MRRCDLGCSCATAETSAAGESKHLPKILKRGNGPLIFSKRDANTYFDLLRLHRALSTFFGRPRVNLGRLAESLELDLEELRSFFDDSGDRKLRNDTYATPVAATWPMGFSWSSYVAQEQMLAVCRTAGLEDCQLLCLEEPCPTCYNELATVATDDVLFVHTDRDAACDRLLTFDGALSHHNITKNCDKDVNCADSITALGVDISNTPPWVEPEIAKLCRLLYAFVRLVEQPTIAPVSLAGLMGLAQWVCQISRWMFSTFDCVYAFQRREPQIVPMELGENALEEILLFVAFAPLLQADLERPFSAADRHL